MIKKTTLLIVVSLMALTACSSPVPTQNAPTSAAPTPTTGSMEVITDMPSVQTQLPAATEAAAPATASIVAGSTVNIQNFAYTPATLTVKVGTTVTWMNLDSVRHTVTSDDSLFDSGYLSQGQTFSYTFSEVGEYAYHCTPHPYMQASITVTE